MSVTGKVRTKTTPLTLTPKSSRHENNPVIVVKIFLAYFVFILAQFVLVEGADRWVRPPLCPRPAKSAVSALNLKEIPYDIRPVSLIKAGGEQHSNEFREINPMEQVPALHIDGVTLVESLSILSYLEETRVQRPLLPPDVVKRAKVTHLKILKSLLDGNFAHYHISVSLKCD